MAENETVFEEISRDLLHFISKSPSPFHAARGIKAAFVYDRAVELREEDDWEIEPGQKYVVTRNGSAVIAFTIPEGEARDFRIIAAHSDSPTFRIKENPELSDGPYVRLNVEQYGGMIMSTWMDRPLSIAGRVIVKENGHLAPKLIAAGRPLLVIPSLAIHFNREVNQGYAWNVQKDLLPLWGLKDGPVSFLDVVAAEAKCKKEDIYGHDLSLVSLVPGTVWGADNAFVSSPRLDDLQCAFAAFRGYTMGKKEKHISVFALFDNEEVGSGTRQGAGSTFLADTLVRLAAALGISEAHLLAMLSRSFMISADNAHAVHPNYPSESDPVNRPVLNGGIVIKFNAQQKYCTDGWSAAFFRQLCEEAGVPVQVFTNRSDRLGGSTLGNISITKVAVPTVDIGLPQLAMHSSYETAGVKDTAYLVTAAAKFFE